MTQTLKKIGISIAVVSVMTTSSFAFFGFDDFDGAKEYTQIAGWIDQADRWRDHLKKIKEDIASKTGIRHIISFEQEMKQLTDFMDKYSLDFMSLSDEIIDKPKSQVGLAAKKLFEKYNVFDNCNYKYMSEDEKKICKGKMIRNVQEIATYQLTTSKLKKIVDNLKELSKKRVNSKDIKESTDVNNAIQMQLVQLQLIKTQLDMMESQNRARERIDAIRSQQRYDKTIENTYKQSYKQ